MNAILYDSFERVPQFHTDKRTKESLRKLITVIGELGTPSIPTDGYLGYWDYVIKKHRGKQLSERSQQYREKPSIDTKLSKPAKRQGNIMTAGTFSVLGEVVDFPRDSHAPLAIVHIRADLLDGSDNNKRNYPTVWADYEISTAPANSELAGGVGISALIRIYRNDDEKFTLPDSIMEVWDEMRLRSLRDYPEEGPLQTEHFDCQAEHLQALTRLALGQWPA